MLAIKIVIWPGMVNANQWYALGYIVIKTRTILYASEIGGRAKTMTCHKDMTKAHIQKNTGLVLMQCLHCVLFGGKHVFSLDFK